MYLARLDIAQGAAQRAHLDLEIGLLNKEVRPNPGDQLVLADQLAGAFDERGQDVESTAAEPHRPPILEQEAPCRSPAERAKRDRAFIHEPPGHLPHFTEFYRYGRRL